nr:MAG TPA: hypothetical protein [Caudoviricetes sp.]
MFLSSSSRPLFFCFSLYLLDLSPAQSLHLLFHLLALYCTHRSVMTE